MRVSVIVPVRNGERVIHRCLDALSTQDLPASDYEVIVVDDGSTDDTPDIVRRYPGVRLIQQSPGSSFIARNRGLAAAQGDIILFTDADCRPKPDWARRLATALEESEAAGAKGAYVSEQQSLVARFVQIEYETKYVQLAQQESIDFIDTYAAAYTRAVLKDAGGFDERFPLLGDQELSFRVAERGYKMVFVPEAVVGHLHADSLGGYARKKFRIGYWKALVLSKHPGKVKRDSHTPQVLKLQMALTGLLGLAIVAALLTGRLLVPTLVLAGALIGSWVPFLRYAYSRDRAVFCIAPLLLLTRAVALGTGLVWGTIHLRRSKDAAP